MDSSWYIRDVIFWISQQFSKELSKQRKNYNKINISTGTRTLTTNNYIYIIFQHKIFYLFFVQCKRFRPKALLRSSKSQEISDRKYFFIDALHNYFTSSHILFLTIARNRRAFVKILKYNGDTRLRRSLSGRYFIRNYSLSANPWILHYCGYMLPNL